MDMTADARLRIDAHLDAVENVLRGAGQTREQRRGVVDDLEAQIIDMLAARSQQPTLADVEAVLAQLDPPGAYGGQTPRGAGVASAPVMAPATPRPRFSRTAIWGLVCILASFLPLLIMVPAMFFFVRQPHVVQAPAQAVTPPPGHGHHTEATAPDAAAAPAVPDGEAAPTTAAATHATHAEAAHHPSRGASWIFSCGGLLALPLALLGTVLGWVAFGQIKSSNGALEGIGLALFDGLFYPAVVILILPFVV